jgi:hypothetical protein
VLKLGSAAAWFTSLASAVRFALEDAPALEDVPEPLDDVAVPGGAELDEELPDEQAASTSAAAVMASADAALLVRLAREVWKLVIGPSQMPCGDQPGLPSRGPR